MTTEYKVAVVIDGTGKGAVAAFDTVKGAAVGLKETLKETESASKSTGDAMEDAGGKAGKMGVAIGAAAAAAIVGLVTMTAKAINNADAMGKLGERLGVTTEWISAMGYAAEASDSSLDGLTRGLVNLSTNVTKAAGGAKQQSALFAALGIDVRDAAGHLRTLEQLLPEIADRFKSYEDGPAKAALANKLFGSGIGTELLPLLNQGAGGLDELRKKAKELGVEISGPTAIAAAQFNDNLTDLKTKAVGLFNFIAERALPILVPLSNAFVGGGERADAMATDTDYLGKSLRFLAIFAITAKNAIDNFLDVGSGTMEAASAAVSGHIEFWAEMIKGNVKEATDALVGGSKRVDDALTKMQDKLEGNAGDVDKFMQDMIASFEAAAGKSKSAAAAIGEMEAPVVDVGHAAKETAEDLDDYSKALVKIHDPTDELNDMLDRYAGSLGGPVARANIQHKQALADIARLERDLLSLGPPTIDGINQIAAARAAESQQHQVDLQEAYQEEADAAQRLLDEAEGDTRQVAALWSDLNVDVSRGWGGMLDSMKQSLMRWLNDIASQMLQSGLSSIFSGLFGGGGGAGGGGFMSTLSSLFSGGAGGTGGGMNFGGMLGGLFGGGGSSAAAGAAFTGAGLYGGNGALGLVPNYGAAVGTNSVLANGSTAASGGMSGAAAVPIIGWIIAGLMANQSLYRSGWRPEGGRLNYGNGGSVYGGGIRAGELGGLNAPSSLLGSGLRRLGIGGETAAMLSGEAITTRLFGHQAPTIRSQGNSFNIGPGGATGQYFANIRERGGLFRSDRNYTRTTALDPETQAAITGFFEQLKAQIKHEAAELGVTVNDIVSGAFKETRNKKGELTEQFSTVLGVRYDEDQQAFFTRLAAENRLATIGQASPEASALAAPYRANANQLMDAATMMLDAQRDIVHGVGLLGSDGGLPDVVHLIEDLRAPGEGLQATYARVSAEAQLFDDALAITGVSIDGTREEIVRLAVDIADASDGLEGATRRWQRYFDAFYGEGERTQRQLEQLMQRRDTQAVDLGLDPSISKGAARRAFEEALPNLSADAVVKWLDFLATLADVNDAVEAITGAQQDYVDFLGGLQDEIDAFDGLQFGTEMRRIRGATADAIGNANTLARAAGQQGASERELGLIHRWAANQIAAAIKQLQEETRGLMEELGYDQLSQVNQQIATMEAAYQGLTNSQLDGVGRLQAANDGLHAQQMAAIQSLQQSFEDIMLGDLSPLSPEDQIEEARSLLQDAATAAQGGDVDAIRRFQELRDQFLRLERAAEASGDDYAQAVAFVRELQDRIVAASANFPADAATQEVQLVPSPALIELYRQRDELLAGQTAANRLGLATDLAAHLRDLALASNTTIFAVAAQYGIDLAQFVTDLGGTLGEQTVATTTVLASIANTLDVELSELADNLGIELGTIADANSVINDSLELAIAGLPEKFRTQLEPALRAVETATSTEEGDAALIELNRLTNLLPEQFRMQLAPYLDDVDPYTEQQLGQLDYLSSVDANTAAAVVMLTDILAAIRGTPAEEVAHEKSTGASASAGLAAPPRGPVSTNDEGANRLLLAMADEIRALRTQVIALQEQVRSSGDQIASTVARTGTEGTQQIVQGLSENRNAMTPSRTNWGS